MSEYNNRYVEVDDCLLLKEEVVSLYKSNDVNASNGRNYLIKCLLKNGKEKWWSWTNEKERDKSYDGAVNKLCFVNLKSENKIEQKGNYKMLDQLKDYFKKHQEIFMTVFFVLLEDHFFFNGALRERVKKLVEGLLTKVENSLTSKENGNG